MNTTKSILTVLITVALTINLFCSTPAQTVIVAAPIQTMKLLEGKTMSILGDSISTFENVSGGTAAETTNSTIGNNATFYSPGIHEVYLEETWWYQAAERLGMEILVNNSWSGSCVRIDREGPGAYKDRAVQLHDDTGDNAGQEPDIIAVYLGANDYYYDGTIGTEASIDYKSLIVKTDDGYTYAQPTTMMEAYAIMLHKIITRYKDAEVYCFTILPHKNANAADVVRTQQFNNNIEALTKHFQVQLVDLYNDSGITSQETVFNVYMGDVFHPNAKGMDVIADCFVDTVLRLSDKVNVSDESEIGDVNTDGDIEAVDALVVLKNVVGLEQLSVEQQALADVNGDTEISAEDALLILKYIVRLIEIFPVQEYIM